MSRAPKEIRTKRHRSGRYLVGYLEEPGVWHQSPEEEAPRALAWAKRNRARLLTAPPAALTLRPFLEGFFLPSGAWVTRIRAKGQAISDRHLANYEGQARNYLIPLFGDEDPRQLSARQIDDVILAATAKGGRALASATKYKILHAFSLVLADLAEQGLITVNPLLGVKPYSKAPTRPRSAIPREALAMLFPATHGAAVRIWGRSIWAALMAVLFDTGMRPGEARALRWGEINEREGAIVVRHAVKAGTLTIGETKTGNVRAGSLSARTLQELAIWRAESRFHSSADFVFTLEGEAPVTDAAIGEAFRRGLLAIGKAEEPWTPYWLRHSMITYSLAALDDGEVMMLAGHSNIAVNARYRHPDDETVIERTRAARGKLRGR